MAEHMQQAPTQPTDITPKPSNLQEGVSLHQELSRAVEDPNMLATPEEREAQAEEDLPPSPAAAVPTTSQATPLAAPSAAAGTAVASPSTDASASLRLSPFDVQSPASSAPAVQHGGSREDTGTAAATATAAAGPSGTQLGGAGGDSDEEVLQTRPTSVAAAMRRVSVLPQEGLGPRKSSGVPDSAESRRCDLAMVFAVVEWCLWCRWAVDCEPVLGGAPL